MKQDILLIKHGIIVHQVNCQKKMGAGLALQIRNKYPKVYQSYLKHNFSLGQIQLVNVAPRLYICNLAGQDRYGYDKRYTNYNAIKIGLIKLNMIAHKQKLPVYIPRGMGCGLAGGDWNIVKKIIEETLTECEFIIVSKN